MGNARGIPRDSKSSPVRMRRADQFTSYPSSPHSLAAVLSPSFTFPSAGSARGEHGLPRDLAPLPLRAHLPSSLHCYISRFLSLTLSPSLSLFPPPLSLYLFISFLLYLARFLFLLLLYLLVPPLSSRFPTFFFLRCCVLCIPDAGTLLIKLTLFLFPHPHPIHSLPYLSSSRFISLSGWSLFSLHPLYRIQSFSFSSTSSSSSGFPRFTSYIPNTASANKAVFRKPRWILRTFWEIAFPWCGRNCMFRRVDDEILMSDVLLTKCRTIFRFYRISSKSARSHDMCSRLVIFIFNETRNFYDSCILPAIRSRKL